MTTAARRPAPPAVHFPALHRVHPRGWLNDPNGILRHDGRRHVYFQHHPDEPRHRDILWGHMSSTDLVHWQIEPHGPVPRPGEADRGGCWSGVGLVDTAADGTAVPTLVYSGVDGVRNDLAPVIVARTDPGLAEITRSVLAAPVPEGLDLEGVRDPFLVEHVGRRWAIQGAGIREGDAVVPAILLFDATDLERWEYVGPLLTGHDPVAARHMPAEIWECPQLVRLGEDWVLTVSRWFRPGQVTDDLPGCTYLVGQLRADEDGVPSYAPRTGGIVDRGPDFYAPQAVVDAEAGRVLAWGWSWEHAGRTQEQTDAQGWAGCLTFPRQLALRGGVLISTPPAELAALRGETLTADGGELALAAPFRAELRLAGSARVLLRRAAGAEELLLEHEGGPATLLLDGGIVELLPQRAAAATVRMYPEQEDAVVILGEIEKAWALRVRHEDPSA